jgi:hypothetical protein
MAYFTEYTADGLGVLHRGEGIVTGAQVSELQVSAAEVQAIADENRVTAAHTPDAVVAVIAPLDHAFGVSRMWETLMDATNWTTRIFRGSAEARAWLREQAPNAAA